MIKKHFLVLFIIFFLINNVNADPKLEQFKKDLEKLDLEQKPLFCYPVFEVAQYNYVYTVSLIFEDNKTTDENKRIISNKYIKAFKSVYYYQTAISFWSIFKNQKDFNFKEKPSISSINKILQDDSIIKNSYKYFDSISYEKFVDMKILSTCAKALEPFILKNKDFKKTENFLKGMSKEIEEAGLERLEEITSELIKNGIIKPNG